MTTLGETLSAIHTLLVPLVDNGTLKRVVNGIAEQTDTFPAAEVRFGPTQVTRDQDNARWERSHDRTGVVRLYVSRGMRLEAACQAFVPLIDAVDLAFAAAPDLEGAADRFDATGHGGPPALDEELGALFVEVGWRAVCADAGSYVEDW